MSLLVLLFIFRDWVGVQCTACDAYALHEHLNVQDKRNEGKNRRGECSRRENRDGKAWGEFSSQDMQNKKTPWEMVFFVFGLDRFFYRLKLLRWLIKSLPNAFRGCEESPVPGPLLERIKWYKKRARGVYILYKLMMVYHHQNKDQSRSRWMEDASGTSFW